MIGIFSYRIWLIDLAFADSILPFVLRSMKHGNFDTFVKQSREANERKAAGFYSGLESDFIRDSREEPGYYLSKAKNGARIAILPISGAITKNGDACSWGWRDYQNTLSRIEANPNIAGTVFHYNNAPGGSLDGTPEFAVNIKSSKKPNVGFADGYAASAHYWSISQSDHIMMNKLTPTELGSIGVYSLYQNIQNQIEAGEYPQMKIVRAKQSVDKVKLNFLEEMTEELESALVEDLTQHAKIFISEVKKARGERLKSDDVFTGKMFGMKESLELGLADSKGTLQDAINLAAEMSGTGKLKGTSGSTSQVSIEMKYPKLSQLFSGEAWNKVLSIFAEDQASLEASEKKVADAAIDHQKLKEENEASAKKITELEKSVSDLTGQVSTLTAEKTALETEKKDLQTKLDEKPAGYATTVVSEGDPEGKQEKKYRTSVDAELEKYTSLTKTNSK